MRRIGGKGDIYIRQVMRTVFDDQVLVDVTWNGTARKKALKDYEIIDCVLEANSDVTRLDMKTFLSQFLRNAPRRLKSRKYT